MKVSYIITITPILPLEYLNLMIHSLNLQTNKNFDVIFYNQTIFNEEKIFEKLEIIPQFEYGFFSVGEEYFLGQYPIWNLYGFHKFLLDENLIGDYFMSLHMEEFFDTGYTKEVYKVLETYRFDVLLGNLNGTNKYYKDVDFLLKTSDVIEFNTLLQKCITRNSIKWGMPDNPFLLNRDLKKFLINIMKIKELKWRKSLKPTNIGYYGTNKYLLEDLYFMSKEFALKSQWFHSDIDLYFEDIHINFRLGNLLSEITRFPFYFTRSKIYHLRHPKYYYQILDDEFTTQMLDYKTQNPILNTLKEAIKLYRNGEIDLKEALTYSRKNATNSGTSDVNYKVHFKSIKKLLET